MRWLPSPYVLLALAVLFWAGNFVLGRAMSADIPPVAFSYLRWLLAGLILTPFAVGQLIRHADVIRREWRMMAVIAVLGVAGYNTLSYWALSMTTTFNAAVMMSAVPVVIPVLDFLVNRERIGKRQALGIVISLCGVLTILFQGDWARAVSFHFGDGELVMVVAVLVWAGYSVSLKNRPAGVPSLAFLLASIWIGVIALTPVYIAEHMAVGGVVWNLTTVMVIGYVAVFASLGAYLCWNRGVAEVGPVKAGLFSHLMPVFSAILAYIFLGETLVAYHFIGMALILSGLFLTARSPKPV